jgi:glucose-1-phosphate thymidylyltransferase
MLDRPLLLTRGDTVKALILAGGKGTRLRPITNSIAKHLIPVANKPLIFYILEQIKEAGIQDVGIIISPDTGEEIKKVVGDGTNWGINISYYVQSPALGIAHAIKFGRDYLGDSTFLLYLGDNLIKDSIKNMVSYFINHPSDALIALKEVEDPRAFGVAELNGNQITRVLEKPTVPTSNLAIVGAYIFRPIIHSLIDKLKPSQRGEYEITDAIQSLLENDYQVNSYILENWWLDTGKKEDLLKANNIILDENLVSCNNGETDDKTQLSGQVEIGYGSVIQNSLITGPVSIAADCRIIGSYVGPHVSLDQGVNVENSNINSSIVLSGVSIKNVSLITESIIGRNAVILKSEAFLGTKIFIGDNARIEF